MLLAPQNTRTFFVTSITKDRRPLFQSVRMAALMVDVLNENRGKGRFLLHEFVIMPDHFHALITPEFNTPLEKAVQYIKGGFSHRAKKELDFTAQVWQASFTNHRIRDVQDFEHHRNYIRQNPVSRFLAATPTEFPYSSARLATQYDPAPPWLKP